MSLRQIGLVVLAVLFAAAANARRCRPESRVPALVSRVEVVVHRGGKNFAGESRAHGPIAAERTRDAVTPTIQRVGAVLI